MRGAGLPWAAVNEGRDPFGGGLLDRAQAESLAAFWRDLVDQNRAIAVAVGISRWKRRAITGFLASDRPVRFANATPEAIALAQESDGGIAVWPSRASAGLAEAAADADLPLWQIEDGFIRSIGLGAAFVAPCSIVVDRRGIYYDPSRPSDLEHILEHERFGPELLARAERLAERVVSQGISKYGRAAPPPPRAPGGPRTVLVAGQVEDDASVAQGGAGVAGNLDLLRRARAAEPDARILFKPHPDVDAGHRVGGIPDSTARRFADEIVRGESMPALLARVDAVHVLTSLTGFEALLRGVAVVTHGHPFFAGWGLTRDLASPVARRTRRLTLAELVAGTLIRYPRYLDPVTGLPCPPEVLLDRFAAGWRPRRGLLMRARQVQGRLARLVGTTTD